VKDLASVNGEFGSILVDIKTAGDKDNTKKVIREVKKILLDVSKDTGLKFYLAGDAIIHYSLGEYIRRDFFVFLLPTYLIIILLMVVTIGRLRDIVISLTTITLSLIWSMGIIAVLGKTINNVTVGIMPLVLCISLEDIYYIHNAYYKRLPILKDKKAAFKDAIRHTIGPCFFTSFTTVIGFGSLLANNIKPIIDFGILGSIAVIFAFVIAVIFIPSIHLLLKMPEDLDKKPRFKINPRPLIAALEKFIIRKKKLVWFIVPLIFLASLVGISKIKIETDHLTFFHKKSEAYKGTKVIENNLAGASNLEIVLSVDEVDGIKNPEVLREKEKLEFFLREQDKIDKAVSITSFLKDMNRAMHDYDEYYYRIPETREMVAQYLLVYSMSPRRNDVEKDFVDSPYRLGRIRCRMSEHNSTLILKLIDRIKVYIARHIHPSIKVRITSYPVIYSNMVNSLASGQLRCLILVFFSLFIATAVYFKSLKIGLLALIPNIIPITVVFGFMGYAGITLNVATAMTAGIAIGLAMDDTTHIFSHFKHNYSANPDYEKDTINTLYQLGEPMIYSSLLMMAGYLVLALSQFRLTVFFGFLCALTIFIALLSDVFITSWILINFKPKFRKDGLTA